MCVGGRDKGRKEGRNKGKREGEREVRRERGRAGKEGERRDGGTEGRRDGGTEGRREGGRDMMLHYCCYPVSPLHRNQAPRCGSKETLFLKGTNLHSPLLKLSLPSHTRMIFACTRGCGHDVKA